MLSDMRAGKAPTYEPKEDNIEGEEAEEENEAAPAPSPAPAIEEPKATPVEHEPMPRERSRETTPRLLGGGYVEQRQIPIDRIRPLPERKEGSKNTFAASSPWDNPDSRLFNAYVELCDWNKKEFNDPVVGRKRDAIFNASESILSSLVANGGEQKYILLLENAVYDTVGELVKMYKSGKSLDDSMNIYIEKLGGLAEGLPKLDIGELIRKSYKGAA
ncbi:MAG: hypothetical protein NT016_02155 [Candidatus Aenigmarchaeota archaeon]|nr:hypothetical protein [Candidatus Aenigmarchaeota archaeon]